MPFWYGLYSLNTVLFPVIWSDVLESTTQDIIFSCLALKVFRELPRWAIVTVLIPSRWVAFWTDYCSSFFSISNCSLLKGLESTEAIVSVWITLLLLSRFWVGCEADGFQSSGWPWIFQHVSFVWPVRLQWSHHGQPPLRWLLLFDWVPQL